MNSSLQIRKLDIPAVLLSDCFLSLEITRPSADSSSSSSEVEPLAIHIKNNSGYFIGLIFCGILITDSCFKPDIEWTRK
jgi:hypothetical protein